jgi:hypothetical protein
MWLNSGADVRYWTMVMVGLGISHPVVTQASPGLSLPEVSVGNIPYKTFSGPLCDTPTPLLTVPEGQEFLVTMVTTTTDGGSSLNGDWMDHGGSMLTRDSVPILAGQAIGKKASIPVAKGTGRLPIPSGSALAIQSIGYPGCSRSFYLQGYYIQEGSPYRAFYNSSALSREVLTVETGQTFLVRTAALSSRESPNHCHVWVDGEIVIDGDTWATTDRSHWGSGSAGGFASGLGTLVLTEGMKLEVGPVDVSIESQCDYYIAGETITP